MTADIQTDIQVNIQNAQNAARAWTWPSPPQLIPFSTGLINESFAVHVNHQPVAVLQRLNTRIFHPSVHYDIHAVTQHLAHDGIATPVLIRTSSSELWHSLQNKETSETWRCLTFLGNRTIERIDSPLQARSAAMVVSRFHSCVRSLKHTFEHIRPDVHNTAAHIQHLHNALNIHRSHRLYDRVSKIAHHIVEALQTAPAPLKLPLRVIHGDLKISNVRFVSDQAYCLIDFDTVARSTLDVELGDAMRSWCNRSSENTDNTWFDLRIFKEAIQGYVDGCLDNDPPQRIELESIVDATERIALELAARFARDALQECYFGFDPRFGSRGEHNLLRAQGQLALARSIRQQASQAKEIVQRAIASVGNYISG